MSIEKKRKTHTSSAVTQRYKAKTYTTYTIRLRKVDDKKLIDYIEDNKGKGIMPTETLRSLFYSKD